MTTDGWERNHNQDAGSYRDCDRADRNIDISGRGRLVPLLQVSPVTLTPTSGSNTSSSVSPSKLRSGTPHDSLDRNRRTVSVLNGLELVVTKTTALRHRVWMPRGTSVATAEYVRLEN